MNFKFNKNIPGLLTYVIKRSSVCFWCSGVDENVDEDVSILLDNFLLDISKGYNIFLSAYRLPDVYEVIDANVLMSKAETLLDPFHTFFHLDGAKVKSLSLNWGCEIKIYYFDQRVKWDDFLATSGNIKPAALMKEGLLGARFSSLDHGAYFRFECTRKHETEVFQLMDGMQSLGWELKQSLNLPLS